MALNLLGLLCVCVFYFITTLFGFCAYRCVKKVRSSAESRISRSRSNATEIQAFHYSESHDTIAHRDRPWEVTAPLRAPSLDQLGQEGSQDSDQPSMTSQFFIANGDIGWMVGSLSLLASRTGGLMPNATSQEAYQGGLIWCLYPVCWIISLAVSFIFYSSTPRHSFVTLSDWFQKTYGRRTGAAFSLPVILAELIMASLVMSYAGSMISVYGMEIALGITPWVGALVSAMTVFFCLCSSGLYASIISDGLQLAFLWAALFSIFGQTHPLRKERHGLDSVWGLVDPDEIGNFLDHLMVLTLGSVPLQSNFQRLYPMLKKQHYVKISTTLIIGTIGACVPPIYMGVKATSLDFRNETSSITLKDHHMSLIPQLLVLKGRIPEGTMVVIIGALAAGYLASVDSNVFAAATAFCQNVVKGWMIPTASEKDVLVIARICLFVFAIVIALPAAFRLRWQHCWLLPFDILAVSVFPQLFCINYLGPVNTYGAVAGFTSGMVLRLFLGDRAIHLPEILKLPYGDPHKGPLLPFRTACMVVNLVVTVVVSATYQWLFEHRRVSSVQDIFLCFAPREVSKQGMVVSQERVQKITVI